MIEIGCNLRCVLECGMCTLKYIGLVVCAAVVLNTLIRTGLNACLHCENLKDANINLNNKEGI